MKNIKQKQTEALARKERNVHDYKNGNLGSVKLPEGADKVELLKVKLANAEREVEVLGIKLGRQ